jgi:hypothetical protein
MNVLLGLAVMLSRLPRKVLRWVRENIDWLGVLLGLAFWPMVLAGEELLHPECRPQQWNCAEAGLGMRVLIRAVAGLWLGLAGALILVATVAAWSWGRKKLQAVLAQAEEEGQAVVAARRERREELRAAGQLSPPAAEGGEVSVTTGGTWAEKTG